MFSRSNTGTDQSVLEPLLPTKAKMVPWSTQVRIMLRRNFLIKSRTWKETSLEVLMPLAFFSLMVLFRFAQPRTEVPVKYFDTLQSPTLRDLITERGCLAYYTTNSSEQADNEVERVMNVFRAQASSDQDKIIKVSSEEQVLSKYTSRTCNGTNKAVFASIGFQSGERSIGPNVRVKIRINGSYLRVNEEQLQLASWRALIPDMPYYESGFMTLQEALAEGVVMLQEGMYTTRPHISLQYQLEPIRRYFFDPLHDTMV
ncbi:hypothetical protein AAMO2058_001654200, partial [Amorphochlora amoebiformis]